MPGRSNTPGRDAIFGGYLRDRPIFTLTWPSSLCIPAGTDPAEYWISVPPATRISCIQERCHIAGWEISPVTGLRASMLGEASRISVSTETVWIP